MRRFLARLGTNIVGIFNAMEGRPLPTPYNVLVWWRLRRRR